MMKKIFLFYFLVLIQITAQNLDSLYNEFLRVKGVKEVSNHQVSSGNEEPVKCSFGIVNSVKLHFNSFSPKQKVVISQLSQRPTTETSFVTPSGKFRIHYNKTGSSIPGYDLNELAKAADSSYNFEVNILKYPAPISDNGSGGDDKLDIYIQNLAGGDYGYTYFDNDAVNKGTNFIVIDNDFSGSSYATNGIAAARVTVAHELHHSIQMGNYIYREEDLYFYEATSTAMEEFVFDSVNDYYFYINRYFRNVAKTIVQQQGYDIAIWNIFLQNNFGHKILKDIWELMPTLRAIDAISKVLVSNGTTLKSEFNKFGLWCYFTGSRAVPGKYFEEAAYYPMLSSFMSSDVPKTISVTTDPISNNYYQFNDGTNKLISIITNADIQGSLAGIPTKKTTLEYSIVNNSQSGYKRLSPNVNYFSKITSQDLSLFAESNILNDIPLSYGNSVFESAGYPFPQPFVFSKHQFLFLPASLNGNSTNADVYIYSPDMSLVYSGQKRIVATEKIVVALDVVDLRANKLTTGVYFYAVKCGDDILKGKITIYND